MSPFTAAQQAFLDQMRMNNTDERALRIIEAAFKRRNNNTVESQAELVETIDRVAG